VAYHAEQREGRWCVVDRDNGWELAPVFEHEITATEIAQKVSRSVAFFSGIPVCDLDSPVDERRNARVLPVETRRSLYALDS
jgi:hypothetical protein